MTFVQRLRSAVRRDRDAPPPSGEEDAPVTSTSAPTRATGGASGADAPDTMDANSTTGTTESGDFVGRAGSDEPGDVGLSGAEARGEMADGQTGAARPD